MSIRVSKAKVTGCNNIFVDSFLRVVISLLFSFSLRLLRFLCFYYFLSFLFCVFRSSFLFYFIVFRYHYYHYLQYSWLGGLLTSFFCLLLLFRFSFSFLLLPSSESISYPLALPLVSLISEFVIFISINPPFSLLHLHIIIFPSSHFIEFYCISFL